MLRIHRSGTRAFLVVVLAAIANSAASQATPPDDPVGRWRLKCVSPDGKRRECVVVISRDGNALRGVYVADGQTRSAKTVTFDRGILSVQVAGRFVGQAYTLTYRGKPSAASYCGTVCWSYGWASGEFGFEGERLAEEVAAVP